jgi:hypothetical protein
MNVIDVHTFKQSAASCSLTMESRLTAQPIELAKTATAQVSLLTPMIHDIRRRVNAQWRKGPSPGTHLKWVPKAEYSGLSVLS